MPDRLPQSSFLACLLLVIAPIQAANLPTHVDNTQPVRCGLVGGGAAYPVPIDVAAPQTTVRTFAALSAALANGDRIIHIPDGTTIDVPNRAAAVRIPDGTVIYGDRTTSAAPHLRVAHLDENQNNWAVITTGSNVRLFGLRLQGPSEATSTNNLTIGIQTIPGTHGLVVENSELRGWPGAAISIKQSHGASVVANYIHHNRRTERGYGVVVQNGDASVAVNCNVFNHNRHAIAGSGLAGESWLAMGNLILPDGAGHAFDMHRAPNAGPGGTSVVAMSNWFAFGGTPWGHYPALNIRGVPLTGPATITGNWFRAPLAYLDAGKRNKRAVEGVVGAVPKDAALSATNQFGVDIAFRRNARGCAIAWAGGDVPVDCGALLDSGVPITPAPP